MTIPDHRTAVAKRLFSALTALQPIADVCRQVTYGFVQVDEEGRDKLFMVAVERVGDFIGAWGEIAIPCAKEYKTCQEEEEQRQVESGETNATGETAEGI